MFSQIFAFLALCLGCFAAGETQFVLRVKFANGQQVDYTNCYINCITSGNNGWSNHSIVYRQKVTGAQIKVTGNPYGGAMWFQYNSDDIFFYNANTCAENDKFYNVAIVTSRLFKDEESYINTLITTTQCTRTDDLLQRRMVFYKGWQCNDKHNNFKPDPFEVAVSAPVADSPGSVVSVSVSFSFLAKTASDDECAATSITAKFDKETQAEDMPSHVSGSTITAEYTFENVAPNSAKKKTYAYSATVKTRDGAETVVTGTTCVSAKPDKPVPKKVETMVLASPVGNTATLRWEAPDFGWQCPDDGSHVYAYMFDGKTSMTESTSVSVQIPELTAFETTFTWIVLAQNGAYASGQVESSFVAVSAKEAGEVTISAPAGNIQQESGDVAVQWEHTGVTESAADRIMGYTLQITDSKTGSVLHAEQVDYASSESAYSAAVPVASLQTVNDISVAVNLVSLGHGVLQTATRTLKVCTIAPSRPRSFTSPNGTSITCTKAFTLALAWVAPQSWGSTCAATREYRLQEGTATLYSGSAATFTVTSVACADTTKTFSLAAYNGHKYSEAETLEVSVCKYVAPQPPTTGFNTIENAIVGQKVTLKWGETKQWGNVCKSGSSRRYVVYITQGGKTRTNLGSATSYTMTLGDGGDVTWCVRARNNGVESACSAAQTFTTCVVELDGEFENMNTVYVEGTQSITFKWMFSDSTVISQAKVCGQTVQFTFAISVQNSKKQWEDVKTGIPLKTNGALTDSVTVAFDTAPDDTNWKVSLRTNLTDGALDSDPEVLSRDADTSNKPPVFGSSAATLSRAWLLPEEDVTVRWGRASVGLVHGEGSITVTYTVNVDGKTVKSGIPRSTLSYTHTGTLTAGTHEIAVVATNGWLSSSLTASVCVVAKPAAPELDASVSAETQVPPFAVEWAATSPAVTCGQTVYQTLGIDGSSETLSGTARARTIALDELEDGAHSVEVAVCVGNQAESRVACTAGTSVEVAVCNYASENAAVLVAPDVSGYVECGASVAIEWAHNKVKACVADRDVYYVVNGTRTAERTSAVGTGDYGTYGVGLQACNAHFCSGVAEYAVQCCLPAAGTMEAVGAGAQRYVLDVDTTTVEWKHEGFAACGKGYRAVVRAGRSADSLAEVGTFRVDAPRHVLTGLADGEHFWQAAVVSDEDGRLGVATGVESFIVCHTTAPEAPVLTEPGAGSVFAVNDGQVTLRWRHSAWGEVCDPAATKTYAVYVAREAGIDPSRTFPAYTTTNLKQAMDVAEDGTYYWVVGAVASTGRATYSAEQSFTVCRNTMPAVPQQIRPESGGIVRLRDGAVFGVMRDAGLFGEGCLGGAGADALTVKLRTRAGEAAGEARRERGELVEDEDPVTSAPLYSVVADSFGYGAHEWAAEVETVFGGRATSGWRSVRICDAPAVPAVGGNGTDGESEDGDENGDEEGSVNGDGDGVPVMPFGGVVRWAELTTADFGYPCSETSLDIRVTFTLWMYRAADRDAALRDNGEDGDGTSGMVREVVVSEDLLVSATEFALTAERMPVDGAVYEWALTLSNGEETSSTPVQRFRSPASYCGAVLRCGEHGTCHNSERRCVCDEGWDGRLCTLKREEAASVLPIVLGAGIPAVLLLIGGAILLFYFIKKRGKKQYEDIGMDTIDKRVTVKRVDCFKGDQRFVGSVVAVATRVESQWVEEVDERARYDSETLPYAMSVAVKCSTNTASTNIGRCLSYVYAMFGKEFVLFEAFLSKEISEANSLYDLCEGISMSKIIFTTLCRIHGCNFATTLFAQSLKSAEGRAGKGKVAEENIGDSFREVFKPDLDMSSVLAAAHRSENVNSSIMLDLVGEAVEAILNNTADLPLGIVRMCCSVTNLAQEQLSYDESVVVVGVFLFRRFFCQALANPENFVQGFNRELAPVFIDTIGLAATIIRRAIVGHLFNDRDELCLVPYNDYLIELQRRFIPYVKTIMELECPENDTALKVNVPSKIYDKSVENIASL